MNVCQHETDECGLNIVAYKIKIYLNIFRKLWTEKIFLQYLE